MKRLVIDASASTVMTALTENGKLMEIAVERTEKSFRAGDIYAGTVIKIYDGQFAFIDIGADKNAFLYLNDNKEKYLYENGKLKLKNNQTITVQIDKEATGAKGAVVTTRLAFAGKYVVILVNDNGIGISKKLSHTSRAQQLQDMLKQLLPENYGAILRTHSESATDEAIADEADKIIDKSLRIVSKGEFSKPPYRLLTSLSEAEIIMQDSLNASDEIVVNNKAVYENLHDTSGNVNIVFYDEAVPIFSRYGITTQIKKALEQKVWLKSGGFIIIDYTEACTVIDVNSGKFISRERKNTVLRTNCEAAAEIAHQLRLRNISGMIIIDFIDMDNKEDRNTVFNVLSDEIKKDRILVNIVGMTELGLMQLTRRKTHLPISSQLMKRCPVCSGTGMIESEHYITSNIRNQIINIFAATIYDKVCVTGSEYLINNLKTNNELRELEIKYGKKISFSASQTQKAGFYSVAPVKKTTSS